MGKEHPSESKTPPSLTKEEMYEEMKKEYEAKQAADKKIRDEEDRKRSQE